MPLRTIAISTIMLAALGSANAALAADLKSAVNDCEPGAQAQLPESQSRRPGETPLAVQGAVTVSPAEAKCLMNKLGKELMVVAAVGDEKKLPGAIPMPWAAVNESYVQEQLADELDRLTQGRKSHPLLVYCHHAACSLSPRVAERMVNAGYKNVFWLRSGMDGWKKADLAFAGEEEEDAAQRFAKQVAECDVKITTENVAYTVARKPADKVDAELASDLAEMQDNRKSCLQDIMPTVTEGKRRKADLAQRIARSDAELARAMKDARAAFNANPAAALVPVINGEDLDDLRKTIADASAARSLAARCGYYDFSIPNLNNAVLDTMKQRLASYRACIDQVAEDRFKFVDDDGFHSAVRLAELTKPYTCSVTSRPGCVPDEVWSRLGRVATRDQLQMVERADRTLGQLSDEVDSMRKRLNEHVDAVNAQIAENNERVRNSDSGYGYGGYQGNSYPQPEPAPYRRPSDTSAAGIR